MRFPGVGDVAVRWYRVRPEAPDLPFATVFNSLNWDLQGEFKNLTAGEVRGAPRPWVNGREPAGTCDKVKGSAAAWLGSPAPLVVCCPKPLWWGAMVLTGQWLAGLGDQWTGGGGLELDGTGGFSSEWPASGGLELDGTGTFASSWPASGGLELDGDGSFVSEWPAEGGLELDGDGSFVSEWPAEGGLELDGSGTFATTPGDDVLPGAIIAFGTATQQTGYLLCDGSAVSRSTYSVLFSAIGTNYGIGDGSTTFNLPNLLGRVIVGEGSGSGLSPRAIGATGGEENHTLSTAELPSHTHGANGAVSIGGTFAAYNAGIMAPPGFNNITATGATGSGNSHNTMQPFGVASWQIKT